jgi:hypothetical protein
MVVELQKDRRTAANVIELLFFSIALLFLFFGCFTTEKYEYHTKLKRALNLFLFDVV